MVRVVAQSVIAFRARRCVPLGDERARLHCGTRVNARRRRGPRRARSVGATTLIDARARGVRKDEHIGGVFSTNRKI